MSTHKRKKDLEKTDIKRKNNFFFVFQNNKAQQEQT
jgi:hypothetical protein